MCVSFMCLSRTVQVSIYCRSVFLFSMGYLVFIHWYRWYILTVSSVDITGPMMASFFFLSFFYFAFLILQLSAFVVFTTAAEGAFTNFPKEGLNADYHIHILPNLLSFKS